MEKGRGWDLVRAEMKQSPEMEKADLSKQVARSICGHGCRASEQPLMAVHMESQLPLFTSVFLRIVQRPHQNQLVYLLKIKIFGTFHLGFCSIRMSMASKQVSTH